MLALSLAGALYLFVVDPGAPGGSPDCLFWELTGLQCPGCGTLRMLHALLHGELAAAFLFNPIGFLMLPVLLWFVADRAAALLGRRLWHYRPSAREIWLLAVLVLVWWVGRNLFY